MAKASLVTIDHLEIKKRNIAVLKKTFNVTDNVEAVKMAIDAMAEKSELESIFERHKGVKIKKVYD